MRIAHLPSSYLPEDLGGTEVYVSRLCRALLEQSHHMAVVWHAAAPPSMELNGLAGHLVRLPPHPARKRADLYRHSTGGEPPGFRAFLSDWRPDVIHFHAFTLGAGLDHARVARRAGIPYVITYHTPAMSCPRGTLMQWGTDVCDGRLTPNRCAACALHARGWPKPVARAAAQSPLSWHCLPEGPWLVRFALPSLLADAHACWREFFHGSAHILACAEFGKELLIVNGVPADRVTVLRQALPGGDRTRRLHLPLRSHHRPVRLGFFGRFTPVKGPDLLLEAIRHLRGEGIDVVAEVVGPVSDADQGWARHLLNQARGLAQYRGVKHGDDLAGWLATLDLVVLPSRCLETGPLTLLEAWDRGVPVLGSNLGGIRDFLTTARLPELLFSVNDPFALAAAVRRALAWDGPAPEVRIPGMDRLAQRMTEIYEGCLATAA